MDAIIDAIWQLPWYEVMYIAIMDDFIFSVKVWPAWVVLAGILVLYYQLKYVWKPTIKAKKRNKDKRH